MSMPFALEYMAKWLRTKHNWSVQQCSVQYNAEPPLDAGQFHVAIDDGGVEGGPDTTDSLLEVLTVNVGIWRRPEHFQKDRIGMLKLPVDKYLAGAWTLHTLERAVIVHGARSGLDGFHANYAFMNNLNDEYNLPHNTDGAPFTTPLFYKGRGRMESLYLDNGSGQGAYYYGYRLRFRGLRREQKLRDVTHALG